MSSSSQAAQKKSMLPVLVAFLVIVAGVVAVVWLWPKENSLTLSGLVQAKEIRNGSQFGGRVLKVLVNEGDRVRQGQPLVEFDDTDIRAKIAEAEANLQQAAAQKQLLTNGAEQEDLRQAQARVQQAQERLRMLQLGAKPEELTQARVKVEDARLLYQNAKENYVNATRMHESGIISLQKLQSIQASYESADNALAVAKANLALVQKGATAEEISIARSELNVAKAQYDKLKKGAKPAEVSIASATTNKAKNALEALKAKLEESVVEAPIAGVVSVLNVTPGELVGAAVPVVSVIDYSHIWTDVYVPESRLKQIRLGQSVAVTAAVYQGETFRGQVSFISPKSEFIPSGSGGASLTEEASFRVKVTILQSAEASAQVAQPNMAQSGTAQSGVDQSGKKASPRGVYRLFPGMKVSVRF
ncbi:MAG: efflux RND transporter periplasmic adaptor subunit [Candidatus Melainabacteria bacterium]|nr:efflux RND transporter periplasmic adaptor subunit [Candidatus Melainabacteria bacterium]